MCAALDADAEPSPRRHARCPRCSAPSATGSAPPRGAEQSTSYAIQHASRSALRSVAPQWKAGFPRRTLLRQTFRALTPRRSCRPARPDARPSSPAFGARGMPRTTVHKCGAGQLHESIMAEYMRRAVASTYSLACQTHRHPARQMRSTMHPTTLPNRARFSARFFLTGRQAPGKNSGRKLASATHATEIRDALQQRRPLARVSRRARGPDRDSASAEARAVPFPGPLPGGGPLHGSLERVAQSSSSPGRPVTDPCTTAQ